MSLTIADLSFAIEEQSAGEYAINQEITIKHSADSAVVARTTPQGSEKQVIDNGDGTYTVKDLAAGYYDVFINDQPLPQPELTRIGHLGDHIGDEDKHREINDTGESATDLWSANKIKTGLDTKAGTAHNHSELALVDHNHNSEYAGITHSHDDLADSDHTHENDYLPINPSFIPFTVTGAHLSETTANIGKVYYFKGLNDGSTTDGKSGLYMIVADGAGFPVRITLGETTWTNGGGAA